MRFAMKENAVRVDYTCSFIIVNVYRADAIAKMYKTPVGRCTGDSFLLLFDLFPFTQVFRGVPTNSYVPFSCVRGLAFPSPIWPDARSKSSSARIYLISPLYAETTGWPNRLSVPSDWITQATPQSNWICSASNSDGEQRNTTQIEYNPVL